MNPSLSAFLIFIAGIVVTVLAILLVRPYFFSEWHFFSKWQENRRRRRAQQIAAMICFDDQPSLPKEPQEQVPQAKHDDDVPTDLRAKRLNEAANDLRKAREKWLQPADETHDDAERYRRQLANAGFSERRRLWEAIRKRWVYARQQENDELAAELEALLPPKKRIVKLNEAFAGVGSALTMAAAEAYKTAQEKRNEFYQYPWTPQEAGLQLKALKRQLDARGKVSSDLLGQKPYEGTISTGIHEALKELGSVFGLAATAEELHSRINFLEDMLRGPAGGFAVKSYEQECINMTTSLAELDRVTQQAKRNNPGLASEIDRWAEAKRFEILQSFGRR